MLIGFDDAPDPELVRYYGGRVHRIYTLVNALSARIAPSSAQVLARRPDVTYVERDGPVYALESQPAVPWGIDRVFSAERYPFETWNFSRGAGIRAAILDTGIDDAHPNLTVTDGISALPGEDPENYSDDCGHGTAVAGIVGAPDEKPAAVGVAPEVELGAVRVLDGLGRGSVGSLVTGIEWSVRAGFQVLNMSLGTVIHYETLAEACRIAWEEGHLLVAAAGNFGNPPGLGDNVSFPARYPQVAAVAASNGDDMRSPWSSTGPAVELTAPGADILSTYIDGDFRRLSGTSTASAHVTGGHP